MLHVCSKQYKRKDNKNVNIVNRKLATLVTKRIVFSCQFLFVKFFLHYCKLYYINLFQSFLQTV